MKETLEEACYEHVGNLNGGILLRDKELNRFEVWRETTYANYSIQIGNKTYQFVRNATATDILDSELP